MKQKLFTLFLALVASVSATFATPTEITVAKALEIGAALSEGAITEETYDIVGYVTQIDDNSFNTSYKNMVFWIADENNGAATNAAGAFEVYRGKPTQELKVGDKVSVKTKIQNYKGTIESISSAPVTLLQAGTGEGSGETSTADVVFDKNDFAGQGVILTGSPVSATKDGVTFTCDMGYGDGQYGVRCYKGSTVTITSATEQIAKIEFEFGLDKTGGLDPITVVNAKEWIVTLPSQTRMNKISIYFGTAEAVKMDTITAAEAKAMAEALPENTQSEKVAVKAYVASVTTAYDPNYGNITIWLTDDPTSTYGDIQAYRAKCTEEVGNTLMAGNQVLLVGKLSHTTYQPEGGELRHYYEIAQGAELTLLATEGTCGDNLTWTLVYSVLTISGTGAMEDYSYYSSYSSYSSAPAPWYDYRSSIKSVIISDGVTSIGDWAFGDCSSLTSVTIGNSVTSIGNSAFYNCSSLISVTIGNSVTSIGEGAFQGCKSLTSITIPNSVTSIGSFAFSRCSSLTSPVYNAHCFAYMPPSYSGLYAIPEDIKQIAGGAFYECSSLTSVTIPNSVTSIGWGAFADCSSLSSITIPNSVTSIGKEAFYNCSGLTSVTIPNSVTSIESYAFYKCSSLTSITIPNSVTSIGDYVFENCTGLTSVTIEAETPPTLGSYAFNNTNNCPIYVPCGTLNAYKTAWSYSSRITHSLSQECIYTISTTSANPEWGTTAGDKSALYLDEVEISATANYGYHFVRWNDNNRSNPRTVSVTEDKTYTATFAKNVYSITANAAHGSISGNSSAEYLDYVTLTVTPDYGYHFTQWSDGLKDNPRIAQITQDTTFTAEFAYDRVGTCGKDLALVWSYDPNSKVLTIGNAGEFTENMRFGVEAPNEMEELVIGNSVTAIGENAFAGISTLKKVTIGEAVKTIHNNAFYNCVNLETIFNYRPTPTNAYSTAFDGVDKFACSLYVLPSSIDMYKAASVWRDFYYTYAIGAEEATVTTNNVTVEPQDNAATVTWPTSGNAATYTLQITKDGEVFCTLIFNANGQLTGIAFAPSRDGQAHAPAAIMTANGLQFTVTGLNSNTQYGYNLTAKDANDQTVATYSGSFTTTSEGIATGVEEVSSSIQGGDRGRLILRDGQVLILRNGRTYTMQGQEVK